MKAFFAGSFDPITNGHLSLIEQGLKFVSELHIVVGNSGFKKYALPGDVRVELVKKALKTEIEKGGRIEIHSWSGLITEFAKEKNIWVSIRGVRNSQDYEYESNMAEINKKLSPQFETIMLPCAPDMKSVSSSAVRELLRFDGDIRQFVPESITPDIKEFENAFKKN